MVSKQDRNQKENSLKSSKIQIFSIDITTNLVEVNFLGCLHLNLLNENITDHTEKPNDET